MQNYESIQRFLSDDSVAVLISTVSFSPNMTEETKKFYKSLADEFDEIAKSRIFPLALKVYIECTDRRKKYRYRPWRAEFSVSSCEDDYYHLTVSSEGKFLINELHTWKAGGIAKRKMIKN